MLNRISNAVKLRDVNDYFQSATECVYVKDSKENLETQNEKKYFAFGSLDSKEKIKLYNTNCTSCSGCLTSAETVLVGNQTLKLFFKNLNEKKIVVISIASQVIMSFARQYNITLTKSCERLMFFCKKYLRADHVFNLNGALDISLLEARMEFIQRFRHIKIPVICTECPGFINFAKKEIPEVTSFLSAIKSPQQIMGTLIKRVWKCKISRMKESIYHVSIMPCFDKKLEAFKKQSRYSSTNLDVDQVIDALELNDFIKKKQIDFLQESYIKKMNKFINVPVQKKGLLNQALDISGSNGWLENIFLNSSKKIFGIQNLNLTWNKIKNNDLEEVNLVVNTECKLRFLKSYGFKNMKNVTKKINQKKLKQNYIEFMACSGGCRNGAGLLKIENQEYISEKNSYVNDLINLLSNYRFYSPEQNEEVIEFYRNLNMTPGCEKAKQFFYRIFE